MKNDVIFRVLKDLDLSNCLKNLDNLLDYKDSKVYPDLQHLIEILSIKSTLIDDIGFNYGFVGKRNTLLKLKEIVKSLRNNDYDTFKMLI